MKDCAIPYWDLSWLLLALTRSPFELEFEHSDIQISFLMTLASDRGRGEVRVWTFKSLKHKTGSKEVTVSPVSVLLAKIRYLQIDLVLFSWGHSCF